VQEVIEEGRNGLLVDFFGRNQIALATVRSLVTRDENRGLRAQAIQDVQQRFSSGAGLLAYEALLIPN
jgi:hypothetical protein